MDSRSYLALTLRVIWRTPDDMTTILLYQCLHLAAKLCATVTLDHLRGSPVKEMSLQVSGHCGTALVSYGVQPQIPGENI